MDYLSSRGRHNVKTIIPLIPPSILQGIEDDRVIDFATAENWVLRDRMTDLCCEAIAQKLQPKHLSFPVGFYGMHELLDAIADYMNKTLKLSRPIRQHDVTILPGAIGCIMGLLWNICDEGDGVLIPGPYWFGFDTFSQVRAGVQIVEAHVPKLEYTMTAQILESLETAFSTSTVVIKALMITNPNNPVGQPWSREMLEAMLRFCQAKNIHLISDEVFGSVSRGTADLGSENKQVTPPLFTSVLELGADVAGYDERKVHAIWSSSKMLGITGLRLGAVVSRSGPELRDSLALATMQEVSVTSSLIVTHILTSPMLPSILRDSSQVLDEHYQLLTSALRELSIPYIPCNAALSVLAKIVPHAKSFRDEQDMVTALREQRLLVGSGRAYRVPEPGWARITFATEKTQLIDGIERLRKVVRERAASQSQKESH